MTSLYVYALVASLNWLWWWNQSRMRVRDNEVDHEILVIVYKQRDEANREVHRLERALAIATLKREADE